MWGDFNNVAVPFCIMRGVLDLMFLKNRKVVLACSVALTGIFISTSVRSSANTNNIQVPNNLSSLKSLSSTDLSGDTEPNSGEYIDSEVPTYHFKWSINDGVLTILSGHLGIPAGGEDSQFDKHSISQINNNEFSQAGNDSLKEVVFGKGVTLDQSLDGLFANLNVDTIDLSNLDTSNVTDMAWMFYQTHATVVGLDKLDYSHVTSMEGMFSNWEPNTNYIASDANLLKMAKTLNDMLAQIDVSHVKNFSDMLATDQYYIDISNWNMAGVTDPADSTTKDLFGHTLWDNANNYPDVVKLGPNNRFNSSETFIHVNAGSGGDIQLADDHGYRVDGLEQPQLKTTTPDDGVTPLQYERVGNGNVFNPEDRQSLDLATLYGVSSSSIPSQWETYVIAHKPFKGILIVTPTEVTLNYGERFDPEKYLYGDYTLYHSIDDNGHWLTGKDVKVTPTVDTSKPGTYNVTYSFEGQDAKQTVIVKPNPYTWQLKDLTLKVGDKYTPEDSFTSFTMTGTDVSGNPTTDVFDKTKFDELIKEGGLTVTEIPKIDTSKPGVYEVTYAIPSLNTSQTAKVTVLAKNNPTPNNSGGTDTQPVSSENTPKSDSSSQPAATPTTPAENSESGAAVVSSNNHFDVYGKKTLYRYRTANFTKSQRIKRYRQRVRIYAPIFHVVNTQKSANGKLRYVLKDGSFITAKDSYAAPLYWQSRHVNLYVINPKGTYEYKTAKFYRKNRVVHVKQGTVLKVKKIVHSGLTTRFELTNGHYVSGNKQWTSINDPKMPKKIMTKRQIHVYKDINFQHKNSWVKRNHMFAIQKWDYSTNNVLRYKIASGYITANAKYVKPVK